MFKNKMILGLSLVVGLGLWFSSSWAVSKESVQKSTGRSQGVVEAEVKETLEVKSEPVKVKITGQRRMQTAEVRKIQQGTPTVKEGQKRALKEEYVKKEILFLPWGKGKGKIGLKTTEMCVQGIATETVRYGPSKIEVDKEGNIFIFDEINKKIHSYNPKGQKGKRLSSVPLSKAEKKSVLIEKFKNKYRYEFIRSKDPTPFAYRKGNEEDWRIGIRILDESNKTLGEILFNEYYIEPLDIDRVGNIYLLVDTTSIGALGPDEWKLEIYKYNREGKFLTKVELLTDIDYTHRRHGQRNRITVDREGNIYQLLPKEDGVHVLKWEIKLK